MFSLFKKEVNGFFGSLSGYVVTGIFLATTGLLLWVIPETGFNIPDNGYAVMDGLFILAPWLFLFLVPAITMRMFSEEHRSGTIELLMTRPLTDLQIVVAKYMAAVLLTVIALIPTLLYFIAIWRLASPSGNVDAAGIAGSYLGLLFLCSAFSSIGLFASSLTSNQVISFLFAVLLCFFFYSGFDFFSSIGLPVDASNVIAKFGMSAHFSALSRGVIDSRDVVYFLSLTVLFVLGTRFVLEKRKW
jgi:ABC-2 type transport system permease protein